MNSRLKIMSAMGKLGIATAVYAVATAWPTRGVAQAADTNPVQLASARTAAYDGPAGGMSEDPTPERRSAFESRADSLDWVHAKARADRSTGFRIVVSLQERHLWVIAGDDTVLSTAAAVAKGTTLHFEGREWTFKTPRGTRTVLNKQSDPMWQPPDWLYAEVADAFGFKLAHIPQTGTVALEDGRKIEVRNDTVGVIDTSGVWAAMPTDEHVIFNKTVFIPPMGTVNRQVYGELGKYRLDLGDGYLLHGTPFKDSIGMASTHGCIRLGDDDIQWLYDNVPVGTHVYIY